MDRKLINPAIVQDIAAAIREKGGQTDPIVVNALGDAIRALPQGMGDNTTEVVEAISGEQPEGDVEIANAIAKGATDAAREHVWQGERATDEGRELRDGVAFVSALRGQSIKMVQEIDKSIYAIDSLFNGISFNLYGESGLVVCNGTSTGRANHRVNKYNIPYANGHKLFVVGCPKNGTSATYHLVCVEYKNGVYQATMGYEYGDGAILTAKSSETNEIVIEVVAANASGQSVDNLTFLPQVFDLTAMYGAGNEPTTPDDFAHRLGYADAASLPYIPYGEQIVNSKPTEVVSRGRNLWDEEWENKYFSTTGAIFNDPTSISSKNLIPISGSTQYYFKKALGKPARINFYDLDKQFLRQVSPIQTEGHGDTFVADSDAHYMTFMVNNTSVYNHDVCINVSDSQNGTYTPYMQPSVLPLPLSSIHHEGQPLFPNGLCGLGGTTDEVSFARGWAANRIGGVDLGDIEVSIQSVNSYGIVNFIAYASQFPRVSLTQSMPVLCTLERQQSSIASTQKEGFLTATGSLYIRLKQTTAPTIEAFHSVMKGVKLYYIYDTPIEVTFDPAKAFYKVQNGGSEEAVMDGVSAPLVADIAYRDNMAYAEEAALLAFANERSGQNDADLGDAIRTLSE